jgi:thiosulfate reductase cytochrome b subunit
VGIVETHAGETRSGRRPQPFVIRCAHWAAIPLLVIMAGSGLQILTAYPMLGPSGDLYGWYPWQGVLPPRWLRFGGWLAGARHWHFALAWLLVANGAMYLVYLAVRGEWRRRLFLPGRDTRNAVLMMAYYVRIRKTPPAVDFYNGLQRLAYTSAIGLGLVEVLSGLAIYKPVQLSWLAALFGGYDGARAVHLLALAGLTLFAVTHIVLVALHPRALVEMVTGGKRAG